MGPVVCAAATAAMCMMVVRRVNDLHRRDWYLARMHPSASVAQDSKPRGLTRSRRTALAMNI